MKWLNQFFEITKNNSSITQEIRAGLTTFLAMAYIIQVHPSILSQAGLSFNSLVTSTVLVCFFSTLSMSLYAKNPLAMAPGLGINSFFTFTMVLQMNIPVEKALGAVFWSGVIFLILSIFKVREKIVISVPNYLKKSLAGGIGLFIAFIGFKEGHFIASSSSTILTQAVWNMNNIIFITGLLILSLLVIRKIKGAFLISILITTLIYYMSSLFTNADLMLYKGLFSWPDFSLIGKLDLLGSLHLSLLPSIFSLAFVDLFESLGTYMALLGRFNLTEPVLKKSSKKSVQPRRLKESLICDALGTVYAGLLGSSSVTAYLESGAGLQEGGRTGLTALTTALLFLPFMFLSPLLSMIPPIATAPILVIIGVLMLESIMDISWKTPETAIPSFLVLFLIPFTFSITNGLIWGFLSHVFIQIFMGKKISMALYAISVSCVLSLIISYSYNI